MAALIGVFLPPLLQLLLFGAIRDKLPFARPTLVANPNKSAINSCNMGAFALGIFARIGAAWAATSYLLPSIWHIAEIIVCESCLVEAVKFSHGLLNLKLISYNKVGRSCFKQVLNNSKLAVVFSTRPLLAAAIKIALACSKLKILGLINASSSD